MKYKNWILVIIANLFIVALLGVLMRYKIAFSLPILEQKHIQHAHSHFAFTAWISQALYLLLIHFLDQHTIISIKKYNRILLANTLLSVAMMISFIIKGYHFTSNTFSFLIILNSIYFTWCFIKDSKQFNEHQFIKSWFYAGLLFNIISTFGTFYLAYLMINKIYHQESQLASVYFYLHFQYNGWFIFTCLGLMFYQARNLISIKNRSSIFWLFFIATFPNYFLSILWLKIPTTIYIIVVISAITQLSIWLYLSIQAYYTRDKWMVSRVRYLNLICIVLYCAFTLKLILQFVSIIPTISHMAYSLRPIVIAYLHLVLLVIISLFIVLYFFKSILNSNSFLAVMVFMIAILINEILLGIQGFAGIFTVSIPYIHYYLFSISILILLSIIYLYKRIQSL